MRQLEKIQDYWRSSSTRLLVFISMLAFSLGGCNTVEGVGKDVEKVGEQIEEAAE